MKPGAQQSIPKFTTDEVVVGELLGSGGYNFIFSLDAIALQEKQSKSGMQTTAPNPARTSNNNNEQLHRLSFATMVNNGKSRHQYVVKFLVPGLKVKKLTSGALDLVREAKMLANLRHKNIISLRGLAEDSAAGFAEGTTGYFLILDRLEETLLQRIDQWKVAHRFNPLRRIFKSKRARSETPSVCGDAKTCFWERFRVLIELASPLVYLHSKLSVVYRDCKPENVGFDRHGTLKIFDFGLAKELNNCPRISPTSTLYPVH